MSTLSVEQLEKDIAAFEKEIERLKDLIKLRQGNLAEFRRSLRLAKRAQYLREHPPQKKHWTKESMVEAVKRFFNETGLVPVRKDFIRVEWLPDPSTIYRFWGPVSSLREAAGLPGGLKGRGGAGRGGGWTPEKQRKPFGVTK